MADDNEKSAHVEIIRALTEELNCSEKEVTDAYNEAMNALDTGARIREFLPILASHKVRQRLRKARKLH